MGRSNRKHHHFSTRSHTLPSSPTHSSSSDFEFTISRSPHKSAAVADELFYKGQLLPLHLSPRRSMVRTLLLSSSSSSDTTTTASRDSTASHSSSDDLLHSDSARPSSATEEEFKRLPKPPKYTFSLSKFSGGGAAAVKRVSSSAKEVLRRYLKKVKPLYIKLSQKREAAPPPPPPRSANTSQCLMRNCNNVSQSFSGNLRYHMVRRSSYISSCPSSMMSSPRHGESGYGYGKMGRVGFDLDASSMEELQNAIQGAIAHCKKSCMVNSKSTVNGEREGNVE